MKCDMHVHSRGRNIDVIYNTAKSRCMDFVTITEHNDLSPALELKHRYSNDTFTGVEMTVAYKKGINFDVLIYNIDSSQFFKLNKLRKNMYEFSKYIKENSILHSFAHIEHTYNKHISKGREINLNEIIDMFDIFEIYNYKKFNEQKKIHEITVNKLGTAGSDAHSLSNIGMAYTETFDRLNVDDFLGYVKNGIVGFEIK